MENMTIISKFFNTPYGVVYRGPGPTIGAGIGPGPGPGALEHSAGRIIEQL